MNKRDPKVFDVYRLDPKTGNATLDTQNPGNVAGFAVDTHDVVRAAVVQKPDASTDVLVRDDEGRAVAHARNFSADDGGANVWGFTPDGSGIYITTAAGVNAEHLFRYDLKTGARTDVVGDPNYDVSYVAFSPKTKAPIAAGIARDRVDITVLDPAYAGDLAAIKQQIPGDIRVTSTDRDDRVWLVASTVDDGGPTFWTYDRGTKKAALLFAVRPALQQYTLAKMKPVTYPARDGMTIHGYLTTPVGVDPKNLPTVIFVHGGPWARDTWGYSSSRSGSRTAATRCCAELPRLDRVRQEVPQRRRPPVGRARCDNDLLDAKDWLVKQGIGIPTGRIMGGSYGGYATLAALDVLARCVRRGRRHRRPVEPEHAAAVDPAVLGTDRSMFTRRMGDTPEVLNAQSPLFKADAIRVPLLIGQGPNDPRVNVRESDQIVAAMRKHGMAVTYASSPTKVTASRGRRTTSASTPRSRRSSRRISAAAPSRRIRTSRSRRI